MPRRKQCRRIGLQPGCTYFKPAGIPTRSLEELVVSFDELEALRLADVEGLYHEQAADRMNVSRRTFGRIIDSARRKVARTLIKGMALRIEGGVIEMIQQRTFRCGDCQHEWQLPFGTGRPSECPECQSKNFRRAEEERGQGGRRRRGGRSAEVDAEPAGRRSEAANESSAGTGGARRRRGRRRGGSA